MFTAQYVELAQRKERLLMQVERDREYLATIGTRLERPFALADKAVSAGEYVKSHPWLAVAAAVSAGIVGRRQLWRAVGLSFKLFSVWRVAKPWLQQLKKEIV